MFGGFEFFRLKVPQSPLYGDNEPCFRRLYIINRYDSKTHKIWQFTTPFPFLGNGVEWNRVVKFKVFLGLMKIYGQ